jgi:ATP-binding cassette subfamily F protein uup
LGANGIGKSTLIQTLLKNESPDSGEVFHADQLAVAYFKQNRETLDPNLSLARTLCPQGDHVEYRGQMVHIKSYLDRFLFTQAQMDLVVGRLSGGEQSRILIAQLMLRPANLLVLDEPTNDLDMATLNVLQDCLVDFEGAILLVTHDRYFLDQVANKIIAFPPQAFEETRNTSVKLQFFSDLSQWEEWFQKQASPGSENRKDTVVTSSPLSGKKKKLSYKDQREFDNMEKMIHPLEEKCSALQKESELSQVATDPARLLEIMKEMEKLKKEIDRLYQRWAELEKSAAL